MADTNGYEIDEATRKRWEMYDREMAELARFRAMGIMIGSLLFFAAMLYLIYSLGITI